MSNFVPWIDVPAGKTQSYLNFLADSQRVNGFESGTAASAIRVNSALRQAKLVVAALMNAFCDSSETDLNSNVETVKNDLLAGIPKKSETQVKAKTQTFSILTTDWFDNSYTKTIDGLSSTNIVFVESSEGSVQCTNQSNNELTFTAAKTQTETVTIKLVIL